MKSLSYKTKKKLGIVSFVIISIVFLTDLTSVQAEPKCVGESGNLYGYIQTENLGPIYVSDQSLVDAIGSNTAGESFYVNFDQQTGIWSGKGWNELAGFVDFSYDQPNNIVRFISPGEEVDNNGGSCLLGGCDIWGGWNGEAYISSAVYVQQNGDFSTGSVRESHDNTGGVVNPQEDDAIGSGVWTFDNLKFQDPACPEVVNLFIDGGKTWHRTKCPADMKDVPLQWTSENVIDCRSTETVGFWPLIEQPSQNTGTSITANGTITDTNSPVYFKLKCKGVISGNDVVDYVSASCGGGVDSVTNPKLISPKLIEA